MKNGVDGYTNVFPRFPFLYFSMVARLGFSSLGEVFGKATLFPLFLFVMVTEVLTRLIKREEQGGHTHGICIARHAPPVSNLLFADDLMLFCRANSYEVLQLQRCLNTFTDWSGQKINYSKSFVHFSSNMTTDRREILSNLLRIQPANAPGKYLGLPLEVLRSRRQACNEIIDKVDRQLATWKARSLSQAGRTVLLKTVAMALPSYYMSDFLLPKHVCKRIDTKMKNFWWGFDGLSQRFHPKAWDNIYKPKECGGLGLRRMEELNKAFVAKLGWEMVVNRGSLWVEA